MAVLRAQRVTGTGISGPTGRREWRSLTSFLRRAGRVRRSRWVRPARSAVG